MKPRNKNQTLAEQEVDEGLKDIAKSFAGGAKKLGKAVADKAAGRGVPAAQKKAAKEREKTVKTVSNQAFHSWKDYEDTVAKSIHNEDERTSFQNHDQRWADTFRQWVSKNLLKGQPIESMSNANDLNYVVDYITAEGDKKKMAQHQAEPAAKAPARKQAAPAAKAPAVTKPAPAPAQTAPQAQPAQAEPTPEPTAQAEPAPELEQPVTVSRGGVERVSTDPMVLRRGRTEYMLGDEGEWVKVGQKHAENESMQALLNQAAEEFENADQEALEKRSAAGYTPPAPPQQPAPAARPTPQMVPGQVAQAPSPEQAAAERQVTAQSRQAQLAQAAQQQAALEKEREAQDAADRAAGIEPPSRGIRKVGGHGQTAQFEPIKESLKRQIKRGEITVQEARIAYRKHKRLAEAMEEKLEREAFTSLVRAAMLAEPTAQAGAGPAAGQTGGTGGSEFASGKRLTPKEKAVMLNQQLPKMRSLPKMGEYFRQVSGVPSAQLGSTGNAAVDSMLTKMGFRIQ